jgi:SAM-dependent methyltransferase
MTQVDLAAVAHLLACPRCGSGLAAGYRCTDDGCALARAGAFPVVAGRWPVLVDQERSVVDARHLAPAAPASGGALVSLARRIVRPRNQVAAGRLVRLKELLPPDPLVLVVGGATVGNGAELLYDDPALRVLALDIVPSEHVQLVADAHRVPLVAGCVDAVVVQAVLEHVLDPREVVDEIHRVLKPEGLVYAETPFMQQVHAGAHDFTRFSDSGHRWLFRRFSEVERGVVAGPGTALAWSIDHLVRGLLRSRAAGRVVRLLFFWLRYADRLSDPRFAADGASAVFFLGRRADGSISPKEAVSGYRGAQAAPSAAEGGGKPSSE